VRSVSQPRAPYAFYCLPRARRSKLKSYIPWQWMTTRSCQTHGIDSCDDMVDFEGLAHALSSMIDAPRFGMVVHVSYDAA
jgi:hypothetical protein